jgi:nicotinamide mononucleotide adenylyltransferase
MTGELWIVNTEHKLENVKKHIEEAWQKDRYLVITCKTGKQRSIRQNSALHLWCEQIAAELNERHLDVRVLLEHHPEIEWNREAVKSYLWKPVQKAQTGEESSAKVNKIDYLKTYEVLNKYLGEKFGIHVPWPVNDNTEN